MAGIIVIAVLNIILVLFTIVGQIRLAIVHANRKMHKTRVTNVDLSNPLLAHLENKTNEPLSLENAKRKTKLMNKIRESKLQNSDLSNKDFKEEIVPMPPVQTNLVQRKTVFSGRKESDSKILKFMKNSNVTLLFFNI